MKLIVDDSVCTGRDVALVVGGEQLGRQPVTATMPTGEAIEVPGDQLELAEEVVGTCPEQAISLIDD
jgi:ferredoxin